MCLVTFFGGGLGSLFRFLLSWWVASRFGESFPAGTVIVNISGCFVIGILAALFAADGSMLVSPFARQFLMIGILGGYTTFSSFSLQTLLLARDGQWLYATGNVVLSVVLCLVGVWLGYAVGQAVSGWR